MASSELHHLEHVSGGKILMNREELTTLINEISTLAKGFLHPPDFIRWRGGDCWSPRTRR